MALEITTAVPRIVQRCTELVGTDPVAHTIFATIAAWVQRADAAGWAAWPDDDPLVLAARSQAHTPLTLTPGWRDVEALAAAIAALPEPAAALAGPVGTVEQVAARLGRPVASRMDERLFRLDTLVAPADPGGTARLAGAADVPLLADWFTAFTVEAFGQLPPGFDARRMVEGGVVNSRCWIWCDTAGTPVSYAVRHPAVAGASRIGPVYTPPQWRGRGYGSAATAAATRDILDDGDIPCLFTDLANPTSNKIYQAIGFTPVLDRCLLRLA